MPLSSAPSLLACFLSLAITGASALSLRGGGSAQPETKQVSAAPAPALPIAKKERTLDPGTKGEVPPQPKVAIRVSPARGFYDAPVRVALSTELEGGKIFYTTNGSAPSQKSGQLYRDPVLIPGTTTLRAAVLKEGEDRSVTETHTYIFPRQVLRQTGGGFPKSWGVNEGTPVPADYEMDPEVVNHPAYAREAEDGLKSIPSLSLVLDPQDLFEAERGIYAHPKESGELWERAASCELIYADGRPGFQIGCGVRVQGGWNRRPEESPKHSLRLLFKKKYGPAKLQFPLFGPSGVREFDTLILRGGCNNTWLHWNGEERRRGDFIRDQWMRDTMREMGYPSARGFFAHLYLNGLYWGLYNPSERPSAPFVAAHLGGRPKDYDSMNGEKVIEGNKVAWNKLMALANGGLGGEREFQAVQEYVDLPNLIDFLILNFYGANADWDRASNWYAARRRGPPGKFLFFVWDGERTLEAVDANTMNFDDDESPPRLFHKLRENAAFRSQFADRVQRHFFNEGVLAAAAAAKRYGAWAEALAKPVILESARWGDYRRDVHRYKQGPYELYTRDGHWQPEIRRLLAQYFPARTGAVLAQFREAGLYPKLDAPIVRRTDGGFVLSAARGKILFTDNGTDPRADGEKSGPSARQYAGPLPSSVSGKIKARAFDDAVPPGTWSALLDF